MTTTYTHTAHVAVYEGFADYEVGHLLAELHTARYTGVPYEIVTVGESVLPIRTMAGMRVVPDLQLADLDPVDSDLLVLAGAEMWDTGGGQLFAAAAQQFLAAGVPVAAICGATAGLARAGLLDKRDHTSAAAAYLGASGYQGGDHYIDRRAVVDGDLITAGPQSPVQFACAALGRLGLASDRRLEAYEAVLHRGDTTAFGELMASKEA